VKNVALNTETINKVKNGLLETVSFYQTNVNKCQEEYKTAPEEVGQFSTIHPKHVVKAFMDEYQEKVDMFNAKHDEVERECESLLLLVNTAFGDSHQPAHLRKFLINLYNPSICAFNNVNLCNLDYKLMRACLDVLSLNCKGYEVHRFVNDGEKIIKSLIEMEDL